MLYNFASAVNGDRSGSWRLPGPQHAAVGRGGAVVDRVERDYVSPPVTAVGVGGVQQTRIADHQFAGPHRHVDLGSFASGTR